MAKRSSKKSSTSAKREAVAFTPRHAPARGRWRAEPLVSSRPLRLAPTPNQVLDAVLSDARQWHPEKPFHRPRATRRPAARLVVPSPLHDPVSQTKARVIFADPSRVDVCARRTIRKQVLFALGKNGRNGQRKRRLNPTSKIGC